ncbi:MAG: sulfopyruvate decarboxylase subunit alpha [Methanomassiliicoccales archaeon]|jgi:sulfopyruvate decarboxylase subunit alpha
MSTRTLGTPANGDKVFRGLKAGGIDLVASVPCVKFGPLLEMIIADSSIKHVPVTREEEGIGICAGSFMGGKRPALLMQNSGLGNCINALVSLDLLYEIPVLMIVSHRGTAGEKIAAQVPMGTATVPLLDAIGIEHSCPTPAEGEGEVAKAAMKAFTTRRPVAVLLNLDFWRV